MQLEKASRKKAKIKLALQGPSGSGKTFSALLMAFGLSGDWSKIAVIDTENRSAELYSNLGTYYTVSISAPFTPEKYIEALCLCEKSGMQVIIIDSISHEWEGNGGILDIHCNMVGNSFTNWAKLTPRHNAFIQAILQSPCHIIATIRSKQDYVLNEKNGRMVPEKIGLKGVTREGMDYEFTLVFDLDIKHNASCIKDRTGLFMGNPEFRISANTGKKILDWCNLPSINKANTVIDQINECMTINELLDLFKNQNAETQNQYSQEFTKRRAQLHAIGSDSLTTKPSTNGINNSSTRKQ